MNVTSGFVKTARLLCGDPARRTLPYSYLLARKAISHGAFLWYLRKRHPLTVKVEITERCVLNCRMCLRPYLPVYPDLTYKDFCHILDELRGVRVFSPHGFGEPLLHPEFLRFMQEVSRRGIQIDLVTNGVLLTEALAEKFLSTCLVKSIRFSVDGVGEKYEWIRRGAKFEQTVANIRDTVKLRRHLSPETGISLYCTLGSYNLDQILPLARLSKELEVDQIGFSDLTIHGHGLADETHTLRLHRELQRKAEVELSKAKRIFPKTAFLIKADTVRCTLPYTYAYVQVNGDVFPCTDVLDYRLGNMFETPFEEIWHGEAMKQFRKNFLVNPRKECLRCYNFP
ncbi:MAG: radical SAM protein [Candidatus Bathyarchaeota archaeon]|nr:radical SAM protein [Candidatus Bathyarchaeota archaeon]MDH5686301.1 radical SAM protein [Candidatus Bathyarchaeota archaeon]